LHDAVNASLQAFTDLVSRIDVDAVARVTERLRTVRDGRGTVFIAGNGGSASTATHWANDLGKATKRSGKAPIRVVSLTDNVAWLTALANDEGYDQVFAGQLDNLAQRGDVLIVISASGNSLNLVRAVELAKQREMVTIGLLGFDGGLLLRGDLDAVVWLPTEIGAYGLVETSHSLVADIITTCLINDKATDSTSRVG
jgi:D-sedoheptulose 7-phosphate isomerase